MTTTLPGNSMDNDMIRINQTAAQRATALKANNRKIDPAKADQVANEFEAQFISQMLENMFSTVDTGGFLGGGQEEETYRSFLIDEYGKLMARSGGIGVADHVKREMLRMQEVE